MPGVTVPKYRFWGLCPFLPMHSFASLWGAMGTVHSLHGMYKAYSWTSFQEKFVGCWKGNLHTYCSQISRDMRTGNSTFAMENLFTSHPTLSFQHPPYIQSSMICWISLVLCWRSFFSQKEKDSCDAKNKCQSKWLMIVLEAKQVLESELVDEENPFLQLEYPQPVTSYACTFPIPIFFIWLSPELNPASKDLC